MILKSNDKELIWSHWTADFQKKFSNLFHLDMDESGIAIGRLLGERSDWRKSHPVDFYARPTKNLDNSNNIMTWEAGIPGKTGTDWEGGVYKVLMEFPAEYPLKVMILLCAERNRSSPSNFFDNIFELIIF